MYSVVLMSVSCGFSHKVEQMDMISPGKQAMILVRTKGLLQCMCNCDSFLLLVAEGRQSLPTSLVSPQLPFCLFSDKTDMLSGIN